MTRAELLAALGLDRVEPEAFEQALLADRSPAVRAVVERQLNHLGTALAAAINLLNPQVIALGDSWPPCSPTTPDGWTRPSPLPR